MFSLYKTIHAPTSVEHSVYCNFINGKDQNLITASANHLQVYRLNGEYDKSNNLNKKLKFECLANYKIFGNVSSMAACRYGNMSKDALILAFMDAKLAIVDYDPATGDLNTLSIHYFEDEIEDEGLHHNIHHPIVRVDPNMRCAVMLIFGFRLAIIPFHEEHNSNSNNNNEGNILKPTEEVNTPQKQQNSTTLTSLSSYVIDLRTLDPCLSMRIIDIDFLFGYYEPTLYILCESNRTWVGRYAVKKDTCNSVAISLNLHQKTNPIIWPVDKLPSDCFKCVPVPPPIGGVLLFAVNSLIYINQSVPSYGVSLNSIAKTTSKYPFKNMENVKITLDCCYSSFLAPDRLILSLKGGEIYIVTLITDSDSLRTVRSFNIEKGPGSVIASCITRCCENYLFIGSRLANSVLLKYSVKQSEDTLKRPLDYDGVKNNAKRFCTEKMEEEDDDDDLYGGDNKIVNSRNFKKEQNLEQTNSYKDELDEILDINEDEHQINKNIVSYSFEICDILLNIAPCGFSIVGESFGEYSSFDANKYHIDLVTSSGYSKNGAVSVLQRSIRPEILTTFEIPDIIDMWSVFNCTNENTSSDESLTSTYLFLGKEDSTMILQIGNEITELDKNLFNTKLPTLNVANIGPNNKYILQLTTVEFSVYDSEKMLYTNEVSNILDSSVKHSVIQNPFFGILTENGQLVIYYFYEEKSEYQITEDQDTTRIHFKKLDSELYKNELTNVQCFSIYADESGIFTNVNIENELITDKDELKPTVNAEDSFLKANISNTVDDEDELLYGSTDHDFDEPKSTTPKPTVINDTVTPKEQTQTYTQQNKQKTYWLFTVSADNYLNIYKINVSESNELSIETSFRCFKFSMANKTLFHSVTQSQQVSNTNFLRSSSLINDQTNIPTTTEILAVGLGQDKTKPYLISRTEDEVIVYEAYSYCDPAQISQSKILQIRFKRVYHDIVIRDRRKRRMQLRKTNPAQQNNANNDQIFQLRTKNVPTLKQFSNIAGYSGFFITGTHPYFVFLCPRSGLTSHPYWIDGPINCFVPLKNSSITLCGFIYINSKFDIRICTLPIEDCGGKLQIYYDSPWVLRKVQLRQTVHYIVYHEESKSYACVTSVSEPTKQLMQLGGEDKELETFERDENFIYPQREQFTIQLYTPTTWEPLPLGKYSLGEWEHVTSFKTVRLPYEGHSSGFRAYLAASTSNCYNEDVNSRGRILIFDVIETVPEPGQPLTKTKMKIILDKEQKGPVTCVESINGNLVSAIGQKIFLWEYKNGELIGRAFVDTQFYVHKMITLKSFLLVADIHRSISLLRFQDEFKKLSFVAKDKRFVDTYACEYLVDNTNLAFLSTDSEKNLTIYMYLNDSHDNQAGQWLVRKGEFNVGSHINSMFRLKCNVTDPNSDKRASLAEKRQVTYCTTLDGSIGFVIPVTEKTFRRLFMLQNALTYMIPHIAGLNPKAYRSLKNVRRELSNPQKNILDGDLLFKFMDLSFNDRNDIAKKIKASTELILDDLTEIYQFSEHF